MNGKQSKRLRQQAKELTVEWIHSLLPEKEAAKVNLTNFQDHMPDQTHVYANNKIMLSAYSEKWFVKQLKKDFYEKRI
jgi:hypothetical protein|tara:strand:- start:3781 stop:4014 length:234 start_codon:yes stop_codon:yes gene_type:complete